MRDAVDVLDEINVNKTVRFQMYGEKSQRCYKKFIFLCEQQSSVCLFILPLIFLEIFKNQKSTHNIYWSAFLCVITKRANEQKSNIFKHGKPIIKITLLF